MKYSRVINRPMFNKHNSAYGRGIASNLVTEEQRQRFNSGGRVKLQFGSSGWHVPTATAGAAGTAAAVGNKIRLPALYKPGWWQSLKNVAGGVGSRAMGLWKRIVHFWCSRSYITISSGSLVSSYYSIPQQRNEEKKENTFLEENL